MSDQEINIAIAEACGWTWIEEDYTYHGFTCDIPMTRRRWTPPNGGKPTLNIPDYCNDLNAMHEEIMSLEGPIRDHSFRRALAKSVGVIGFEDWEHSLVCLDKLTNATASQRAEAFLRTIGKWKD